MYLTWNGTPLPDFIKVVDVTKTSVPLFEHTMVKVVGRMGFQYAGTIYGGQRIDVTYIFAEQPNITIDDMPRYFATFFGLQQGELRLEGKPGYYYKAVLDPPPDVTGIATVGEGSFSFNLYEGYALSDTLVDSGSVGVTSTITINNTGDLPTRPKIYINTTGSLNGFRIINQTTGEIVTANITSAVASGSQVIVDNYREEVYLSTGAPLMQYVSLNSVFFNLPVGTSVLKIDNPYGSISGTWKVTYPTKIF